MRTGKALVLLRIADQRSLVRLLFTDPAVRALCPDWTNVAHAGLWAMLVRRPPESA